MAEDTPPWEDYGESPVQAEEAQGPWDDYAEVKPEAPKAQPLWKSALSVIRPLAQQFVQAPIEMQQNVLKVPEAVAKLGEPVQETASAVASDFLRRTGIDPSAMPGRNIIDIPSIEERMGHQRFLQLPKSVQALVGYHDALAKTASGFTEPGQASLLPLLGTKPAQAVIAAQSLASAPELGRQLAEAKTPSEIAGALTGGTVNALIGARVGGHLAGEMGMPAEVPRPPETPPVPSEQAPAVEPPTPEIPPEGLRRLRSKVIKSISKPFDTGQKAFAEGKTASDNPYVEGSQEEASWNEGFKSAAEPPKPGPEPILGEQTPKGIAASVRNKWTTATEEPFGSESGFINIDPIKELIDKATPYVRSAFQAARDLGKEQFHLRKLDDYGKAVLNWSAKAQKSFQEASEAQREITKKVPNQVRREGIVNWIQADGDAAVLANRLAVTKANPKTKRYIKGYEAALNLTPEEIAVAQDVRNAYSQLATRGTTYDVLKNFKDNYVTQVWDLGRGPTTGSSRTLRDKFRFNKASTFDTYFDGEQVGYTPKTKDIAKILPMYLHEMNSVISARQLVDQLSKGVGSDGRPLVAPMGNAIPVDGTQGKATLVMPDAIKKADTSDYKVLPNQPALHDWRWAGKDEAGNPIFMKSDLALHPEAYDKLKNVLGKSAIREWYQTKGSVAAAIPKMLVRGLDMANSETKRTMLGLLAPFHQVQEGTHAIGHRVNPVFGVPKVDLVNNPAHMDAAKHGLMLQPDRASANQFMEGFRTSGLVSKIPGIGQLADTYSNYLFHKYIPGLKLKTYDAILDRNQKVYAKQLASGEVSLADVKHLSAEQANAAYGHINYTDLARNPTVLHAMRLGLLAPDFFEARARFAAQAVKGAVGTKVGREQVLALGFLALGQAATAYTFAQLTGGKWDAKHPFEFHVGNRRYTMRSVPEDIASLLTDWRKFTYSRISPIIGKGTLQYATGVDWRGQKISAGETTKELLQQPIPISIKGFLGLGNRSLSGFEQLASSVGLRISRYSPSDDVFKMAKDWMAKSEDPKVRARYEFDQKMVYPESQYKPLKFALTENDSKAAREAYDELLKTKTEKQIKTALAHPHPFTGKKSTEEEFVKSLTPDQRDIYDEALKERKALADKLRRLKEGKSLD